MIKKGFLSVFCLCFSVHSFGGLFNIINGVEIKDAKDNAVGMSLNLGQVLEGPEAYVYPNEAEPLAYSLALMNKTGVLISVGTFRSLVDFSLGDFDKLVMLDISKKVLSFNRTHLTRIQEIAKEYKEASEQREVYRTEFKTYLDNFKDKYKILTQKFTDRKIDYYWENDDKWQKITAALDKDNIHVIRGNLALKSTTLQLIKQLINLYDKNLNITLDISNVINYVDGKALFETVDFFVSLCKTFSLLATNKGAFQDDNRQFFAIGNDGEWYYYYYPNYLYYFSPFLDENQLRSLIPRNKMELALWQLPLMFEEIRHNVRRNMYNNELPYNVIKKTKDIIVGKYDSPINLEDRIEFVFQRLLKEDFPSKKSALFESVNGYKEHLKNLAIENVEYLEKNKVLKKDELGRYLSRFLLSGRDLSNVNLAAANLSNQDLSNTHFSKAILSATDFTSAILSNTNFQQAVLNGATFDKNNGKPWFFEASLIGAKINFPDNRILGMFAGSNLSGAYRDMNGLREIYDMHFFERLNITFEDWERPHLDPKQACPKCK